MNREKTHLYKKQHQQPIEEETPPHKKSLTFRLLGVLNRASPTGELWGMGHDKFDTICE